MDAAGAWDMLNMAERLVVSLCIMLSRFGILGIKLSRDGMIEPSIWNEQQLVLF